MFGIDDAALATMLAGGISTAAGLYTNKKNRDYQAEANRINWEIAKQNNATQIEMANTAHEREVRDLRRAGLNPILSAGGNGSPTPTLQAPGLQAAHDENAFQGLANSAKGMARFLSQEYKNQVEGQVLDNIGKGIDNTGKDLENKSLELGNTAQKQQNEIDFIRNSALTSQLNAEFLKSEVEKTATLIETGLGFEPDKDGVLKPKIQQPKKFNEAVAQAREGIRSDWSMRGSAALQSWLGTAFQGLNSAGSMARGFRGKK